VGAANVLRTTSARTALAAATLDAVKGAAVVWVADRAVPGGIGAAGAGVAAILGHIYPVWLRFQGGKGVATTFGVFAVLAPATTLLCAICFVGTVWFTRYVSLGSVVATTMLAPVAYLADAPTAVVVAAVVATALVIERHRGNLARLQAGTERRLGPIG
jgi:glycerol-3-phosphate acyltransferase PlsY